MIDLPGILLPPPLSSPTKGEEMLFFAFRRGSRARVGQGELRSQPGNSCEIGLTVPTDLGTPSCGVHFLELIVRGSLLAFRISMLSLSPR